MAKTENQGVNNRRERLMGRIKSRYPDRTFVGQKNQDGQDGQDDFDQAVNDLLDEYDARQTEQNANNEKLMKLFMSDPRSHEFVNRWVEAGDPLAALIEIFGDDFSEAMSSPESRERFVESHNKWLERKSADEAAAAEREANWQKSLEDLESWGNEKGLDEQKKVNVILRLHQVGVNAIENVYTPEDFEMAFNAMNYAEDVASARKEGEVAGRNAKIEAAKRERRQAGAMPPSLAGQGTHVAERKPETPKSVWAGLE